MKAQWYTHLPSIKLADGGINLKLHLGHLTFLDFGTWYSLDGTFVYSQKKYEKSRPLFFTCELDFEPEEDVDMFEKMEKINEFFYWAILLGSGGCLIPNPLMSCSYYLVENEIGIATKNSIGRFEREWIIYGDCYSNTFDQQTVDNIDESFKFLLKSKDFSNQYLIMNGFRTLQFTANPEFCYLKNKFNYFYGFVHCMSVLEAILVPEFVKKKYNMSITEVFGKNAAAISSTRFDDIITFAPYYSEMYRIRSKMIHGEASGSNFSQKVEEMFKINRYLLSMILKNLVALGNVEYDLKSLPDLLINASKDGRIHDQLLTLIDKGLNYE